MTKEEVIRYWVESSEIDFQAMESLFENGHYVWALFTGHLVLEKLLKALYAKNVDTNAPRIHHLLRLARMARLDISVEQEEFLLEVTTFNLEARYPDIKYRLYKRATRTFVEDRIRGIKEFREWLREKTSE